MSNELIKPIKPLTNRYIAAGVLLLMVFCPGLPWSGQCRHALKRVVARIEMRVSGWQGEQPKLVSLAGTIVLERPRKGALKGAQIEALDSTSGWASLSDQRGGFVLRDVMWYPRAAYTLIIVANDYQARQFQVSAPADCPDGRLINLGELVFDRGCRIDIVDLPGKNSISYIEYDKENTEFYRQVLAELTQGKRTDKEKAEAMNRYVATKLNANENDDRSESPRRVLENGTAYCGKLALVLATLAEAAGFRARLLDLIDDGLHPSAHMVTEIYYDDRWHLYDSTAGSGFRDKQDRIASYKDLRLDPKLVLSVLPVHLPAIIAEGNYPPVGLYRSGFHHYYYLRKMR